MVQVLTKIISIKLILYDHAKLCKMDLLYYLLDLSGIPSFFELMADKIIDEL